MKTNVHYPKCSIEAENLRVAYEDLVALNIDWLDVKGCVTGIIGHNGAGKSTLIKTVLGLLEPAQGSCSVSRIQGQEKTVLEPSRQMAFCPETGSVFGDISVKSYVELWCRIKHNDARYYRKEGRKYIDLLNLGPLLPKLGRELSKGERRRVQTAIGFLSLPALFLFDEPFDGLDVQRTSELAEIFEAEAETRSFIVSSHRMDVIERLADTLIVLRKGEVASAGPVDKVCRELCGKKLLIHELNDPHKAAGVLRETLPLCIVNHIGSHVSVTGSLCEERLRDILHTLREPGPGIEEVSPNLMDAMNFHLRTAGE